MKYLLFALSAAVLVGCADFKSVSGKGMYANGKTGAVSIGVVDIDALDEYMESAIFRYEEDTAWLQPQVKTHKIKVVMTGTNSLAKIGTVAKAICEAYQSASTEIAKANADIATNSTVASSGMMALATASAQALSDTKAEATVEKAKISLDETKATLSTQTSSTNAVSK